MVFNPFTGWPYRSELCKTGPFGFHAVGPPADARFDDLSVRCITTTIEEVAQTQSRQELRQVPRILDM